jgi:hypothetical protein
MLTFTKSSGAGVFLRNVRGTGAGAIPVCLLFFAVLGLQELRLAAAESELERAIREAASKAPVLTSFSPGEPSYEVIRHNVEVVRHGGNRYSLVRLRVPAGPRQPLVLMFSDIGTIQEYEFVRLLDGKPIRGNLRVIYPRLHDPDLEESQVRGRRLRLPRPWDFFELHVLGMPETLLQPGEDYILWFRFEDERPADVLMSSVFLGSGTQLTEAALPAIVGLPELPGR